jgi:diguanylate cyclase (GGDEF)-like protein
MSFFLGSEIFNHQLMARLRRMSIEDELTGLHNRNAMMNRINNIVNSGEKGSVGIVNMDLNGLKRINDTRGHESGDRYLQHAAGVMKDIFGEADVYRSGGDEFIAIVEDKTHEAFSQLLDNLHRMEVEDPEFNLAIGYYWSEDGISDVRTAFKAADSSMYSDKRRYYSEHPELDRRRVH